MLRPIVDALAGEKKGDYNPNQCDASLEPLGLGAMQLRERSLTTPERCPDRRQPRNG